MYASSMRMQLRVLVIATLTACSGETPTSASADPGTEAPSDAADVLVDVPEDVLDDDPTDTPDDLGEPPADDATPLEDAPPAPSADPCEPLGPPEGNIIDVTPDQAVELPGIVLTAPEGSTLLFADGTYNVKGDVWIKTAGLTLRSASGDRDKVILDANYQGGSILVVAASNVTVADMTLSRAYYHGLHFRPPGGAAAHVTDPVA